MVQTLVQNNHRYLLLRGNTYYFRYVIPRHVRQSCPSIPREVKRSLSTDSFATALYFISEKLSLIDLIRRCRDAGQLKSLIGQLGDFSEIFSRFVTSRIQRGRQEARGSQNSREVISHADTPKLSEAWLSFVESRQWSDRLKKNNQLLFNNVRHFLGDRHVGDVTKELLKHTLSSIACLPKRNLKRYKGVPLEQITSMQIPEEDRVSGKTVKEHLKLCQGLFNSCLVKDLHVLEKSPTEGLSLDTKDNRFASLGDSEVVKVIERSSKKPEWFRWFLLLAVYSGARRSELSRLRSGDFKVCHDTGRHYFVIHYGKTDAARRQVPVHRRLVEEGFLEWVRERDGDLFPVAHTNPNRVTDMFSSLLDVKVNDLGERIVFHSLRHTFITKARSAGVEAVLVQQVVGHEKTGAGLTDRYTHTFLLGSVLIVVDSVDYGL